MTSPNRNRRNRNTGFEYVSKSRRVDVPRTLAFEVLQAVSAEDAYANLITPKMLRARRLNRRDSAFATELIYGTLRLRGRYDAIISRCTDKPLSSIDSPVLDLLRLGAHQLLGMRVEPHAAVSETVDLARQNLTFGPAKFVNAVLRRISERNLSQWLQEITLGLSEEKALAVVYSHPEWIAGALSDALQSSGRSRADLEAVLKQNNAAPYVHLVAHPGLISASDLADQVEDVLDVDTRLGVLSSNAVIISGGDPARLPALQEGLAAVEDEGSQVVAELLVRVPTPQDQLWIDLCAGPGGKAGLLGAFAKQRGAHLIANEVSSHRAELVRDHFRALPEDIWELSVLPGQNLASQMGECADRVLVDAPCSGLGALRRRPEARWRKQPSDLAELGILQRELLQAGLDLTRSGGVVAYSTCSPHLAETEVVVSDVIKNNPHCELIEVAQVASGWLPDSMLSRPTLQMWGDRDKTDAMFVALIRKQ